MAILPSSWDPGRLGVSDPATGVPVAKSSLDQKPHHGMPQDRAQPSSAQCHPSLNQTKTSLKGGENDPGLAQGGIFAMTIEQLTKAKRSYRRILVTERVRRQRLELAI